MSEETVEFAVLCSMFEAIIRSKKAVGRRKHVRTFLEHVYTGPEYFSAMRLILPDLDKERANYGLREAVLAKLLADALGLSKESEDAKKLLNWRKGGQRAGGNAGNFSLVAAEVLYSRQKSASGALKIKDINDLLNRLAAAENNAQKIAVLAELISKTNAQEMRWVIMIILKDLKLGMSEKTVFSEFHPDAEDLFNVTCDLKLVCEKLHDRNIRNKRQDIEVGKAVRPQLAARVSNVEEAWKKLRGKEVVVECKFDGDRIQVHKNGNNIHFWSRTFNDHSEFKEAIADVLVQGIIPDKCILDGEMLVWDRITNRFAEFGTNRGVAKAAKDGLDTGQELCYVAFDILHDGDGSVIHRPLRERQQLLQKSIRPLSGRLELLIPEAGGLNSKRAPGEPRWSILASSAEQVEHFFQETIDNREEGVVLKDLDSKWEPSDRNGKWLKLKPDYIHSESDLDVLIIGGYYGSGRRGGEVAQFLCGIAERPIEGGYPTKFYSFCRVGTGLTDDELEHLLHKLKPYFRRNEKGSRPASFYVTTNASKERPDVWIDQPEKSVLLQITSDIRTIQSKMNAMFVHIKCYNVHRMLLYGTHLIHQVFAAPYSLRFPRIQKVRYDKPWYDCLDVQTLVETVHSTGGNVGDAGEERGTLAKGRVKRAKQAKPDSQRLSVIPVHMLVTDVSQVKPATHIFKRLVFYIVNTSNDYPVEKLHKLVVENGGTFSMNLNSVVTHSIALEKKGLKYQAAAKNGDVIHISWLLDCTSQKALLPVGPKYYLHMSDGTKGKMKTDVDEFGDFYFIGVDESDIRQLFENMDTNKQEYDMEKVKHYKKKYCPTPTWCHFCGCCVFFLPPLYSVNQDTQQVAAIALQRLALEVTMHEGLVSEKLTRNVTHVVAYAEQDSPMLFPAILQSLSLEERTLLLLKRVNVVNHHWIEDALSSNTCRHPSENKYELRHGEPLESEEEDQIEAVPASNEVKEVGLSTRSKRKIVRPPRKPIPKKQVMGRVGRASGLRGTKVSAMADEQEVLQENNPVQKGCGKKGQDDTPARSVHLEEVTDDGKKMLRRSGRIQKQKDSSSDSDEVVPRRRLSLDEDHKKAGKLSRGRPTRSAQKRKVMESEKEEPSESAERGQGGDNGASQVAQMEKITTGGWLDRTSSEYNNFAQNSINAMLSDLFPSQYSFQQVDLSQDRQDGPSAGSQPSSAQARGAGEAISNAVSLEDRKSQGVLTADVAPAMHREGDAGHRDWSLSTCSAVDDRPSAKGYYPRVKDGGDSKLGIGEGQPSAESQPSRPPEKKKKVSYKNVVNQLLNT